VHRKIQSGLEEDIRNRDKEIENWNKKFIQLEKEKNSLIEELKY